MQGKTAGRRVFSSCFFVAFENNCCQLTADCGQMAADDNVLSGKKLKTGHLSQQTIR